MNNNSEFSNNQQSQILKNLNSIPLQNNGNQINNQFNMMPQNNTQTGETTIPSQIIPNMEDTGNVNQVNESSSQNNIDNNRFIIQNESAQNQSTENNINQETTLENNFQFSLGTTSNTTYADAIQKESVSIPNRNPFENMPNENDNNLFIHNNANYNETSLNDLNVEGTYNQMERPDYSNEPKVIENIQKAKNNTIPITKELKTFFLIALVLLIFIFIMPYIFDAIRNVNIN